MTRSAARLLFAGVLSFVPVAAVRQAPAAAQERAGGAESMLPPGAPMPVTSDTADYCGVLERRIATHANPPVQVRQLAREGQQMCDHGQVRDGLRSLRRALILLKHKPPILLRP